MDELNYPTDADISLALIGGDGRIVWAIEQIYKRYQKGLFATAFAVLRSQSDAEDAVQKTVLVVYEKAAGGTWTLEAPLKAFLNQTVYKKSVDIIRKRMQQKRIGDAVGKAQRGMPHISADGVLNGLSKAEGLVNFNKFIVSLTPKEIVVAEILGEHWLRHQCVASVKEILEKMVGTEATEASVKTIRKRLWPKMAKWIEKAEAV